ncbi:prepilin-type N-terminal cleavage/methylation domain-containing protein [Escherichia coli]|nr:prepilin-type N-terminal cleavage/methylation domain-containing protein [Escherichia coli]RCP60562.1 prepilin-type N-terminal cleavage/methylation domain-containing protein [Escherichia coli]
MKNSRGLSLIEVSMVLALSAIVVSGVLYYYNNASSNRKLVEDSKTIQMVISTIRTLYENQMPTTSIDLNAVAKAGNFKTQSSGQKTYIVMPTGETVNIISGAQSFGNRLYAIDFFTSDKSVCSHLASIKYGTSHFATQVAEKSGTVDTVANLLNKPAVDRYLTVNTAAEQCSQKIDSSGLARVYMAFKG